MTKSKKRTISLVLALTFLFTLVLGNGMTVFAENGDSGHAHPCGAECAYVEGVDCALEHEHNEDCDIVKAVDCDHDEAACEDCPALVKAENEQVPIAGSITGFETVELAVEVGTAEEDIPFPGEVTAMVQPEDENAEAASIVVGVTSWSIAYGSYDPAVEMPYVFQAEIDPATLPEGVTVGLDEYGDAAVPLARVTVGEVELPEPETYATTRTTTLAISSTTPTSNASEGWDWDGTTLTLNGVDFQVATGHALNISVPATIVLENTNTISTQEANSSRFGVYANANVTISGSGSLDATAAQGSGIYIAPGKTFSMIDGTVTAKSFNATSGGYGVGIHGTTKLSGGIFNAIGYCAGFINGALEIDGATVTFEGTDSMAQANLNTTTFKSGTLIIKTVSPHELLSDSTKLILPATYEYRTADSGSYTKSSVTPYTYSNSDTYLELFVEPPATQTLYFANKGGTWGLYVGSNSGDEYVGRGTTWSADSNTLNLIDFSYTTTASVALNLATGSTIMLSGTNTLTSIATSGTVSQGIYVMGSLTIDAVDANATLTATSGTSTTGASYGIYTYAALTISGGIVEGIAGTSATSDGSNGVRSNSSGTALLVKSGATLIGKGGTGNHANSQSHGVVTANTITIEDGAVVEGTAGTGGLTASNTGVFVASAGTLPTTAIGGDSSTSTDTLTYDDGAYKKDGGTGARATYVKIAPVAAVDTLYFADKDGTWGLYVGSATGEEYTGRGTTWTASANTLNLNGFTYTTTAAVALRTVTDTTINVENTNTITSVYDNAGASDSYGIYAAYNTSLKSLAFTGTGSLVATSGNTSTNSSAIKAGGITIDSITLTAKSGTGSVSLGLDAGVYPLTLQSATVTAEAGSGSTESYGAHAQWIYLLGASPTLTATATAASSGTPDTHSAIYTRNWQDDATVTGSVSSSGTPLGNPIALTYSSSINNYVYKINSSTPALYVKLEPKAAETFTLYFGDGPNGWNLYTDYPLATKYIGNSGKWSAAEGKLTLKGNFNFNTSAANALVLTADTEIAVTGNNSISSTHSGEHTDADVVGLDSIDYTLTVTGTGSLAVTAGSNTKAASNSYGLRAQSLTVDGATLTAKSGTAVDACFGISAPVTAKNGAVVHGEAVASGNRGSKGVVGTPISVQDTAVLTGKAAGTMNGTSFNAGIRTDTEPTGVTVTGSTDGNESTLSATLYDDDEWTFRVAGTTAKYAKIVAAATGYTITLNGGGGILTGATTVTTGADGKLASLPAAPMNPPGAIVTFSGWFTASTGGTQITTTYVFTQNTTIYAQWTPVGGATAPTVTTSSLPGGIVGTAYSQTLAATGTAPITWSIDTGNLPNGLTLNASTGVISGTPIANGAFNFTVKATNSAGSNSKALSIAVVAPPVITQNLPLLVEPGTGEGVYILTVAADNATGYQWYKDGVAIPGETSTTLNVLKAGGDGSYHVVVSGNGGSTVQSNTCVLRWSAGQGTVIVQANVESGLPNAVVLDAEALKNAVLTSVEKNSIAYGANVIFVITLNVEGGLEHSDTGIAGQKAQDEGYTVLAHYDITVEKDKFVNFVSATGEGYPKNVEEMNAGIDIRLDIAPEFQAAGRTFAMVRVHGGVGALLNDKDSNAGTITFGSDRFSLYTLVYEAADDGGDGNGGGDGNTGGGTTTPTATTSPQTGDSSNMGLWIMLLGLSMAAAVAGVCIYRKKGMKMPTEGLE